ncbi:MAG: DUF1761 domain-containing protein [Candidatus Pacearchaeota archaeon]
MIVQVNVNYLTILIASVISFLIGVLWYSPLLFGKWWAKLTDTGKKPVIEMIKKKAIVGCLVGFLAQLVMTYVLAHFIIYADAITLIDGAIIGFWTWFGFVATIFLGMALWENKPAQLYLLNSGYWLLSLIVQGMILSVWQ